MNNSRTKNATLNIAFSLLLQIVVFFRGLILPRIIIPAYGSDVNGLISSITQFLAYITLLEAGVGSIFRTSLYKPLASGDWEGVSGIINEQKRFYRKLGVIFIFYALALCLIYPQIAKTGIAKQYIISCILILGCSTFTEYFVSLPYVSLLSADQKIRISYIVNIVYTLVNVAVSLIVVTLKADIRLIYLSMCVIGLLRPLFYTLYVKKQYNLNKQACPNKFALEQRWNGMVHHIAYFVHTNTDITILTVFIGTAMVSVYNVYSAIIFGIGKIVTSIATGTAAGIGNLLETANKKTIMKTVDTFEIIQGGLGTIFYTITALLLIPFIKIYTVDMLDMNYIQPLFGYGLIIAEAIYCFRCIYSTISINANCFKETQLGAILECVVNISISMSLIFPLGLVGVAVGTIAGMLTRYIFEIVFLSRNVISRPIKRALKMLGVSVLVASISILSCKLLLPYSKVDTFGVWIIYAILSAFIVGVVASLVYYIFYREIVKSVLARFLKGKRIDENNRD